MQSDEHTLKPWIKASPRRRYRRWTVDLPASLVMSGRPFACRVFDISPGGARVQLREGDGLQPGTELELALEDYDLIPAEVRHSAGGLMGLMFRHDEAGEMDLARYLIELRPARPQSRRAAEMPAVLRTFTEELPCTVANLSGTGVALTLGLMRELAVGDRVALLLAGHPPIPASIRYVDGIAVGLALIEGLDLARFNAGADAAQAAGS